MLKVPNLMFKVLIHMLISASARAISVKLLDRWFETCNMLFCVPALVRNAPLDFLAAPRAPGRAFSAPRSPCAPAPLPTLISRHGSRTLRYFTDTLLKALRLRVSLYYGVAAAATLSRPQRAAFSAIAAAAQARQPSDGECFAVAGIQGSSVVLTCSRWHPSQPGVMNRLSEDPFGDSEFWNHLDLYSGRVH